ncbi:MAG: dual specificity protein phosphatase family protein [Candidatus Omnitrophota bacterium]|jgi:tyrosine-protein phosphatase OCA6
MKRIIPLFLFIFLSGCAYLGYLKDPFTDIPAFSQVNENLYRGGYPKPSGYARLRAIGIKTIVNLSNDTGKRYAYEQNITREYGITLIRIPLSVYEWPEDEKVLTFLKAALTPENQPVFVHCTSGRDRTGAMIAVYKVVVESVTIKKAYKEAVNHGFWPYKGEVVLKKYIHQLKDRKIFFEFVENYRKELQNQEE